MTDTESKAEQVQLRILRAMSPAKRLALATGWSTSLRELTRAKLRDQFGDESKEQLQRRFAERWLGPELAGKVYGNLITDG